SSPRRLSRFPAYVRRSKLITRAEGKELSRILTKAEPMNPAPPVTKNVNDSLSFIWVVDSYRAKRSVCIAIPFGSETNSSRPLLMVLRPNIHRQQRDSTVLFHVNRPENS